MNKRKDDLIQEITYRLVAGFRPLKIILFGSHARGTDREDSDVDLLVVMNVSGSKRKKASEMYVELAEVPVPKDILVITPQQLESYKNMPGTIIQSALGEGKTLYDSAA
jgi:uncharacterized protein